MLTSEASDLDLGEVLRQFEQRGYARLGRILSVEAARRLQARATAIMLGEVCHSDLFFQHDAPTGRYEDLEFGAGWVGPSLSYRKLEKLELDPLFAEWIENPLFERIAHAVLGRDIALYRAVLWNKAARGGMELPWHQDDGVFWGLDRAPSLQIWTALDDAPCEAGCVEVLPGSHLDGLASPGGGTVQRERLDAAHVEGRSVAVPVARGEAILIHNHIWHRSGRNRTGRPRRGLGISFLSGATRCTRTRRAPRVFRRVFEDASRSRPIDRQDLR